MTTQIEVNQETETQLPDKLSELVTLALDDAEKLKKQVYNPSCGVWHQASGHDSSGECFVCLGGMVMAGRLEANSQQTLNPSHFSKKTVIKLSALESFRAGDLELALSNTGELDSSGKPQRLGGIRLSKIDAILNNVSTKRMVRHSTFYNWKEFNKFAAYAREVVVLLEDAGF